MPPLFHRRRAVTFLVFAILLGTFPLGVQTGHSTGLYSETSPDPASSSLSQAGSTSTTFTQIFFPAALKSYPWDSPFGVETYSPLVTGSSVLDHAQDLGVAWARLGTRISWRKLQPDQGDPIRWDLLETFEDELRSLRMSGVTPIVIIYDSPDWATIDNARSDGQKTSCAPIHPDKYADFAAFVRSIVSRYKEPEFNVHHWEIGNEPDVDPDMVPLNNGFGCWGDNDDLQYFGGKNYGEMLKVVYPAIKAEDPTSQVWIGGLLLPFPVAPVTHASHPELFLRGILAAGAGSYFDIVSYHWYPSYYGMVTDYDNPAGGYWEALGGGVVGKARYIRKVMSEFGVDKPVFLNETAFGCLEDDAYSLWCQPPENLFYEMQADFLVRAFVRGMSERIQGFSWYTLEDSGWRSTGLLDPNRNVTKAYLAYRQLVRELRDTEYVEPAIYGNEVEGYIFQKDGHQVVVMWAKSDQSLVVAVPQNKFIEVRNRDGVVNLPVSSGSDYHISIGFSPVYIIRYP